MPGLLGARRGGQGAGVAAGRRRPRAPGLRPRRHRRAGLGRAVLAGVLGAEAGSVAGPGADRRAARDGQESGGVAGLSGAVLFGVAALGLTSGTARMAASPAVP